ncbi:MAG TPA: hypothetical protein VN843_16720 [Anaerolineales bacterium]|nr:hypothetical protein [Anaerolineales bacterium]
MKIVTKLFLSLCLVAGLGATLTNAQIRSDATIRANIPYSFVVNNTTLPAGTYVITVLDSYASDLSVLEIRTANGKTAVFFETDPVTVPGSAPRTELVFDKIGDTYFLSKVFLKGDEGNQLLKSKTQRRLEENGSVAESRSIAASPAQAKFSKHAERKTN